VDRDALVRAVRRRQALDALAFEHDRATLLTEQLEETVALLEGQRVDVELYERLGDDDVLLVRRALGDVTGDDVGDEDEPGHDADADADADAEGDFDPRAEAEEELARLQGELELSSRRRAALKRYLDLLDGKSQATSAEPAA